MTRTQWFRTAMGGALLAASGSIGSAQESNNAANASGDSTAQQAPRSSNEQSARDDSQLQRSTSEQSNDRGDRNKTSRLNSNQDNWNQNSENQRADRDFDRGRSDRDGQANWDTSRQDRRQDYRRGLEFGDRSDRGLTISNVERNSVYYRNGFRQNDVIVSVYGRPLRDDREFYGYIRPGTRVPVVVLRDGQRETLYITSDPDYERGQTADQQYSGHAGSQAYLGVQFETRTRDAAVIKSVVPNSPAEEAGLQSGDELIALNGQEIRSPYEATRIVASMQPGEPVDIEFSRRSDNRTQAVLGEGSATVGQYQRSDRHEVYRDGPDYDRVDQSSYDSQYPEPRSDWRNDDQRSWDSGTDRRNNRPLLPRLRN